MHTLYITIQWHPGKEHELEPRKTCEIGNEMQTKTSSKKAMAAGQNGVPRFLFFFHADSSQGTVPYTVVGCTRRSNERVIAMQETAATAAILEKKVSFIIFKVGRAPKYLQGEPEHIIRRWRHVSSVMHTNKLKGSRGHGSRDRDSSWIPRRNLTCLTTNHCLMTLNEVACPPYYSCQVLSGPGLGSSTPRDSNLKKPRVVGQM